MSNIVQKINGEPEPISCCGVVDEVVGCGGEDVGERVLRMALRVEQHALEHAHRRRAVRKSVAAVWAELLTKRHESFKVQSKGINFATCTMPTGNETLRSSAGTYAW